MKKILYIALVLTLWGSPCLAASSDTTVQYETNTTLSERSFNREKLIKAKTNPDFKYDLEQKLEEPSFLDKLLYRIIGFILNLFINPTGSAGNVFFYISCIAVIAGLAFLLFRNRKDLMGIFSRGNSKDLNGLDFAEHIEDINSIDFDKLIEEAIRAGAYRRAVRLYYLKSLKQLSDKSQIVWEINKTNRDYLYELKNPSLRIGFEGITYVYEYVWYGNVEIDQDKFSKVKSTFHEFHNQTAASK